MRPPHHCHLYVAMVLLFCFKFPSVLSIPETWVKLGAEVGHESWKEEVMKRANLAKYDLNGELDDTRRIKDIQDYYRDILNEGWEEYDSNERKLQDFLGTIDKVANQDTKYAQMSGAVPSVLNHPVLQSVLQSSDVQDALLFGTYTKPIMGRYIVALKSDAGESVLKGIVAIMTEASRASEGKVRATDITVLRYAGNGFIATLNNKALELLSQHPAVDFIEQDVAFKRSQVFIAAEEEEIVESDDPPWNLDRIDQHSSELDHVFAPEGDGSNVDIYVIDSGVRGTHHELSGRVRYAEFDAVDILTGSTSKGYDCVGHGTACASIAAGKTYGVAKNATIYNMRAFGCSGLGAVSGIVQGIDKIIWRKRAGNEGRPIVISQSFGVKKSLFLNKAIKRATSAGIVCVSAAGNEESSSCQYSPASAATVISVGATDRHDNMLAFTNTGKCTTLMAPGKDVVSSSSKCDTCTLTITGTSAAAPHVSGYAAILLSQHPEMTPAQVKEKIVRQSTKGAVRMSGFGATRTPNRLLYIQSKQENFYHL